MAQLISKKSTPSGKVIHWEKTPFGIVGETENANFSVTFYDDAIARVTLTKENKFEDFSYSVIASPVELQFKTEESETEIVISTRALQVTINKQFSIRFKTLDGRVINEDDSLGTRWNGDQVTTYKKLQEGERFIGLGEKTGPLDRRGHGYQNWNTDSYAYNTGTDPLYCSTPFYIGIHHGQTYGIFLDNTFKTFFNFGASNDRFSSFSADSGEMNYYFISGDSVGNIINRYTHLTGRMPLPPKWSIGYQQCRYSYFPDSEVKTLATTFRSKDIPADVIVLDIHYMDAYKIFTWHKEHFSNPKGLIDELREMGFEVVVMCDPGIKIEKGYRTYDDGLEKDVFIKYPDGTNYSGQVWPGWCHFPDFTKPEARTWWKENFIDYISLGIKGFWNDMNEIATWGNQLPENIELDFEGHQDTMRRGRNIYGFQMARATYEGTRQLLAGHRPFNLTRSGFSGVQRYAAVWTGDNVASDEHMMLGIRILNSMGLTGIAFCGYDAGGFVGDANPQLFGRWISLATFSPFFRGHSMVNSRDAEPWSFGEEVEEISRNYIKLRYRLMPYLYSLFYEASQTGMPLQRSLAIDYPHDDLVYKPIYQHQYFFGPALLVAPVESWKEFVKVYLPTEKWYNLFTDKLYHNGEVIIESPVEKLPVFVRSSSILLFDAKPGKNTREKSDTLEVHVYHGEVASSFTLYQDDGNTFENEHGNFNTQKFSFDPTARTIEIEKPNGNYESQYATYMVFFHGFDTIESVSIGGQIAALDKINYQLLKPLRSFDPLIAVNEGYLIHGLPFVKIPFDNKNIVIKW